MYTLFCTDLPLLDLSVVDLFDELSRWRRRGRRGGGGGRRVEGGILVGGPRSGVGLRTDHGRSSIRGTHDGTHGDLTDVPFYSDTPVLVTRKKVSL